MNRVALFSWRCVALAGWWWCFGHCFFGLFSAPTARGFVSVAPASPRLGNAKDSRCLGNSKDSGRLGTAVKLAEYEKEQAAAAAAAATATTSSSKSSIASCIKRNKEIMNHGERGDGLAILTLFAREGEYFNAVNLATATWRLASLPILPVSANDIVLQQFLHQLAHGPHAPHPATGPRQFANVVDALGNIGRRYYVRIKESDNNDQNNNNNDNEQDDQRVSDNQMYELVSTASRALFDRLSNDTAAAAQFVKWAAPLELASTARASAGLKLMSPALFDTIEKQADRIVAGANAKVIATIANACAALGHASPQLFAAIDDRADQWMDSAHPRDVATVVRACQELGHDELATVLKAGRPQQRMVDVNGTRNTEELRERATTSSSSSASVFANPRDSSPRDAAIRRNRQIVGYGERNDWRAILELFQTEGKDFDEINLATAVERLARIPSLPTNDPVLAQLLHRIMVVNVPDPATSPRNYASTIYALAKLNVRDRLMVAKVCDQLNDVSTAAQFAQNAHDHDVAQAAWACGELGQAAPQFFAAMEMQWKRIVQNASPAKMAIIVKACAKLGYSSPQIFAAIENDADQFVASATPQDLAMTAWSCAKLQHSCPKLFAAIEGSRQRLLLANTPSDTSITTWACAELGHASPLLFGMIEENAAWFVEKANASCIAMTARACAELGHASPRLFAAIDGIAERFVAESDPRGIAIIARACAKLGHACPNLFAAIEKDQDKMLFASGGTTQHLANLALACAKLRHASPNLFAAIETQSTRFVQEATPQQIANMASACAASGHTNPAFFGAINTQSARFLKEAKPHYIAELARACKKLSHDLSPELAAAAAVAAKHS